VRLAADVPPRTGSSVVAELDNLDEGRGFYDLSDSVDVAATLGRGGEVGLHALEGGELLEGEPSEVERVVGGLGVLGRVGGRRGVGDDLGRVVEGAGPETEEELVKGQVGVGKVELDCVRRELVKERDEKEEGEKELTLGEDGVLDGLRSGAEFRHASYWTSSKRERVGRGRETFELISLPTF
jgi:hypothetical protein